MESSLYVYRTENKYLLNEADISNLKFKLDKLLERDKHSKQSSYIVRSLYFDSINNIDFNTKMAGTEIRKKIRLRTYDYTDDKCKLEIKQKNGDLQHKISMWIKKEDAKKLIKGDYSVLISYVKTNSDALFFYSTMQLGGYKPVALIEYDRIAYTYPMYSTRITFDMNVRSVESNFDLFDEKPLYYPVVENKTILEVKYNEKLMGFISDTIKKYQLNKTAVSKYCAGRKVFYDFNY